VGTAWGRGYSNQLLQRVGECNCVINLGLAGCSTQVTQQETLIGVPIGQHLSRCLRNLLSAKCLWVVVITVVGAWLKLLNRLHVCQSDIACGVVLYMYSIV